MRLVAPFPTRVARHLDTLLELRKAATPRVEDQLAEFATANRAVPASQESAVNCFKLGHHRQREPHPRNDGYGWRPVSEACLDCLVSNDPEPTRKFDRRNQIWAFKAPNQRGFLPSDVPDTSINSGCQPVQGGQGLPPRTVPCCQVTVTRFRERVHLLNIETCEHPTAWLATQLIVSLVFVANGGDVCSASCFPHLTALKTGRGVTVWDRRITRLAGELRKGPSDRTVGWEVNLETNTLVKASRPLDGAGGKVDKLHHAWTIRADCLSTHAFASMFDVSSAPYSWTRCPFRSGHNIGVWNPSVAVEDGGHGDHSMAKCLVKAELYSRANLAREFGRSAPLGSPITDTQDGRSLSVGSAGQNRSRLGGLTNGKDSLQLPVPPPPEFHHGAGCAPFIGAFGKRTRIDRPGRARSVASSITCQCLGPQYGFQTSWDALASNVVEQAPMTLVDGVSSDRTRSNRAVRAGASIQHARFAPERMTLPRTAILTLCVTDESAVNGARSLAGATPDANRGPVKANFGGERCKYECGLDSELTDRKNVPSRAGGSVEVLASCDNAPDTTDSGRASAKGTFAGETSPRRLYGTVPTFTLADLRSDVPMIRLGLEGLLQTAIGVSGSPSALVAQQSEV